MGFDEPLLDSSSEEASLPSCSSSRAKLLLEWGAEEPTAVQRAQRWLQRSRERFADKRQRYSWLDWLSQLLPCLAWLSSYNVKEWLAVDILAGLSVTCMEVPQSKYLLGLQLPRAARLPTQIHAIVTHIHDASWREFAMGSAFILVLVAFKLLGRRSKRLAFLKALGPLTVCLLSIGVTSRWRLYERPSPERPWIHEVGAVTPGLPSFTAGWWLPFRSFHTQLLLAVMICLLDSLEAMSMAKRLALIHGYDHNASQDFRAMGLANLVGASFSSYNATGSFSRSAVNNDVGAKTPLAGGICGVLLALTLVFLTPFFTHMSKNVQGAIIITGVLGLFDWREGAFLYRVHTPDFLLWLVAFAATLLLGVVEGIGVAILLSLLWTVYKTAFPRIVKLARLPDTAGLYRNAKLYQQSVEEPGMLLLRIDAPIYFANVQPIKERLRRLVRGAQEQGELRWVVLNLSPVTDIDVAGVHFLESLLEELQASGVRLALANPHQQVVTLLRRARLLERLGEGAVHDNMQDAVESARAALAAGQQGP
ncbi:hypothetical protein ABPG75_003433 [Micractinium tetrahymenae]